MDLPLHRKLKTYLLYTCSAVDHFKKQFAFLEEHYGKGSNVAPPERQHASLPRFDLREAFPNFSLKLHLYHQLLIKIFDIVDVLSNALADLVCYIRITRCRVRQKSQKTSRNVASKRLRSHK